jgi:HAAS
MTPLESYVAVLGRQLKEHGVQGARRIVDETREHLADAIRDGLTQGLSLDDAEREAIDRFGTPEALAAQFAAQQPRTLRQLLSTLARLGGAERVVPGDGSRHFHDVRPGPERYHFCVRLKRRVRRRLSKMSSGDRERFLGELKPGEVNGPALGAEPELQLSHFLSTFGPRTLGPGRRLESLSLLEDGTNQVQRGGKYLAAFTGDVRMVWTIVIGADGSMSLDGTDAR